MVPKQAQVAKPLACALLFRRLSDMAGHRRRRRHLSSCVLDGPRRHRLKAHRLTVRERPDARLAEDEESGFSALNLAKPGSLA